MTALDPQEMARFRALVTAAARVPTSPLAQAHRLDSGYRDRPHLDYLSQRLTAAVQRVSRGEDARLVVSMPPRSGKSLMVSQYLPLWMLRSRPDWKIALVSHEANLATSWGRQIRRWIEQNPSLNLQIAADAGAASEWETVEGGGVLARSVGGSLTGRGARVMLIDDVHKDFVSAHSAVQRQAIWDWWLTVAQTRLEPPSLVVVVATRWHEDDFIGRLLSHEHEGDPADWENIKLPAIAEEGDVLGRAPGDPLLSPLLDETPAQALERWEQTKTAIGSYAFTGMYQQRPSPAKGKIFDTGWWRFWTRDPSRVTDDGRTVLFEPEGLPAQRGRWLDSWDCAFKGTDASDFVVGQRWCRVEANRFLVAQIRKRMSFTKTLGAMRVWAGIPAPEGDKNPTDVAVPPCNELVHERLVEDKANGSAVIDVMRRSIAGMIPENPTDSKTARARAVTPECESGHVYFPHPADPGNEWVADLLSELREFDNGAHDDQVDALSQALKKLRDPSVATLHRPQANQPAGGAGGRRSHSSFAAMRGAG